MARDIAKTDASVVSRCERRKVEMPFAHLKRFLKLDRLRPRGPCGARDEFLLVPTAQNLGKKGKSHAVRTASSRRLRRSDPVHRLSAPRG